MVAGVLAAAACESDSPAEPSAVAVDVYTSGSIFIPPSVTIGSGDTVRFNMVPDANGEGHNAIFNRAGAPPDVPVVGDTTVARVFNARGTFAYICTVHPGMAGEVVVQ